MFFSILQTVPECDLGLAVCKRGLLHLLRRSCIMFPIISKQSHFRMGGRSLVKMLKTVGPKALP